MTVVTAAILLVAFAGSAGALKRPGFGDGPDPV